MRKLDRTACKKPRWLANYNHIDDEWEDLSPCDKLKIRLRLSRFHFGLCAYCESALHRWNRHIEHFRRKHCDHFPELTFDWDNLFLSCECKAHCGHYKDRKGAYSYNPNDLVKPDVHDPDQFFFIHSYGDVRPRAGISAAKLRTAEETIRVFNLNEPSLQAARRRAITQWERKDPGVLEEVITWDQPDREAFLQQEIEATANDPYSTTIKHFLQTRL